MSSGGTDECDRGCTTALIVDGDIVVDFGTGVAVLIDDELARIAIMFFSRIA